MKLTDYSYELCHETLQNNDAVYFESYDDSGVLLASGIGFILQLEYNYIREVLISVTNIIDGVHHSVIMNSTDYTNDVVLPLGYNTNELATVLDYVRTVYSKR